MSGLDVTPFAASVLALPVSDPQDPAIFLVLAAFVDTAGATVAAFAKSEVTALRAIIALTIITAFLCIMLLASRWIVSYRRRPRRVLASRS